MKMGQRVVICCTEGTEDCVTMVTRVRSWIQRSGVPWLLLLGLPIVTMVIDHTMMMNKIAII